MSRSGLCSSVGLALVSTACAPPAATPNTATPPAPTLVVPPPEGAPADEPLAPARGPTEQLTPSGLRVEGLAVGSGSAAAPGNRVVMHYVGTLEDGTEFDSSRAHGRPLEAELGKGHLIRGLEEGMVGMRVGGRRRLTVPPDLAYGARAVGAKIPANATLVFDIELLEVR